MTKSQVRLHVKRTDFNPTHHTITLSKGELKAECKVLSVEEKSNYYELELEVPTEFILPRAKYEVSIL